VLQPCGAKVSLESIAQGQASVRNLSIKYVLVLPNEEDARRASGVISEHIDLVPQGVDIAVGYIGRNPATLDIPVFVPVSLSIE
jgi:hypothetical protein